MWGGKAENKWHVKCKSKCVKNLWWGIQILHVFMFWICISMNVNMCTRQNVLKDIVHLKCTAKRCKSKNCTAMIISWRECQIILNRLAQQKAKDTHTQNTENHKLKSHKLLTTYLPIFRANDEHCSLIVGAAFERVSVLTTDLFRFVLVNWLTGLQEEEHFSLWEPIVLQKKITQQRYKLHSRMVRGQTQVQRQCTGRGSQQTVQLRVRARENKDFNITPQGRSAVSFQAYKLY